MIGFMSIDHQLLYITKSMGASRFQTLRYVRFPSAVTYIFAGLKISVVLAVIGVIVGEFVGSNAGLGYLLEASAGILNTSLVFADLVILSVLGLILNYLVLACEWLVTPWKRNSERNS